MNQQNVATQPEEVLDPTTQALHRVLARIYGHNGAEEDPSFVEIRRRCKERLRLSDIVSAPLIQEISTDEATIVNAIKSYPGFFVRNDQVKQHHDFMPHNSVLLRDMPAKFSNGQLIELFQGLVLEDGTPCPLPIPEKIRSDGNSWLAVFASVEDAQNALAPVRNKILDGKNIRAVLRNESTRIQQMISSHQKRDGMMPMMYNLAMVTNSYPSPMYGQTTVISGHQPMYYAPPQAPFQYYPYPQPPAYPMAHYGMPMTYSLPQSPYPPAAPYGYDMSMYGVPTSPTMQNGNNNMYNNNGGNNSNNNNNGNKPRRNNNQYANNNGNNNNYNNNNHRSARTRDPNQQRYVRSGEETMISPSGVTATEVAVAALDSQTSVPHSFSADAEDDQKQPEVVVPVISVPSAEVDEEIVAPIAAGIEDAVIAAASAEEGAASGSSDTDVAVDKDNEKSPRTGRKDGKRDGNRGDRKDGKRDGKEGDRRGNGRDAKSRQEKDGKKERKTPPVTLSLDKDFPTLQLGDNSKASAGGKVAFNYANALKKPSDESPKPATSTATNKPISSNNNTSNNNQLNKKDSRSSSKGSSPNPSSSRSENLTEATTSTTTTAPTVAVKKTKTETPAVVVTPAVAVPEPVKVPEKSTVAAEQMPISPSDETPSVETELPAGAKKAFSFIDAVRAKK